MTHSKESIEIIVREFFDSIVESLTDNIYSKLCQIKNDNTQNINIHSLIIDINILSEEDKQKLVKYADDKGNLNVTDLTDNNVINLVLEISAKNGHLEIVKFLVEKGATIDGTYALSYSANNGHLEVVKFLVEKGATINSTSALSNSAGNGHIEVVKFLVEKGATIDGTGALRNSAGGGHLEVVKFLVEKGATINDTYTLSCSARNGHIEVVKFLVEKGATINDTGALSNSARNGHIEVVKFLVGKGATISDNCITQVENDVNKFLFMCVSEDKHHLFDDKIVLELTPIKNLLR